MNKIVQSGPAQDRTRAMSGPLSRSIASLATLDRAWATVPPGAQADLAASVVDLGHQGRRGGHLVDDAGRARRRRPGSSRTRP